MTGDQRLITRIEQVSKALDADQLIAAYHMLDEIVRELEGGTREGLVRRAMTGEGTARPADRPARALAG